jgi:3-oxoacyl-[acyl-carrier-protein] synthase-1
LYTIQKKFLPACLGFEESLKGIDLIPLAKHKNIKNEVTLLLNFVAFGGNNSSVIISNKSDYVYP